MTWLTESSNSNSGKTKIHMYGMNGAANVYIADWAKDEVYQQMVQQEKMHYFPIKPTNGNTLWFKLNGNATSLSDNTNRGVIYKIILSKMLTAVNIETQHDESFTAVTARPDAYNKVFVTVGNRSFTVAADTPQGKILQKFAKEKLDVITPAFADFLTSELQDKWEISKLYKGYTYKSVSTFNHNTRTPKHYTPPASSARQQRWYDANAQHLDRL